MTVFSDTVVSFRPMVSEHKTILLYFKKLPSTRNKSFGNRFIAEYGANRFTSWVERNANKLQISLRGRSIAFSNATFCSFEIKGHLYTNVDCKLGRILACSIIDKTSTKFRLKLMLCLVNFV